MLEAPSTVAAFLLSMGVFLIGGLQAIRGAEIVVLPPREILFYRDALSADADSMVIATDVAMINTASSAYGDVPTSVRLSLARGAAASFPYEASIETTFLRSTDDERANDCPEMSRCIVPAGPDRPADAPPFNTRLLVFSNQRELLDVPGGSARSDHLSFALSDCEGEAAACAPYAGFARSLATLRLSPYLRISVVLDFHSDGHKTLLCEVRWEDSQQREAFFDFLEERGWASARCLRE